MDRIEKQIRTSMKRWAKNEERKTGCLSGDSRVELYLAHLFHEITTMDKEAWSVDELANFYDLARRLAIETLYY